MPVGVKDRGRHAGVPKTPDAPPTPRHQKGWARLLSHLARRRSIGGGDSGRFPTHTEARPTGPANPWPGMGKPWGFPVGFASAYPPGKNRARADVAQWVPPMRLTFEGWTWDEATRQLLKGSEERHLSPKAFELLSLLIESRPRALAKAELRDQLWPQTFVSEAALQSLVAEVRAALGDDARHPRFVRTVHGFGYAFAAEAAAEPGVAEADAGGDAASHRLYWRKREVTLAQGENVLGRTREAAVWIDSSSVSRRHACITLADDRARLEDLDSKNGTFRGDRRITEPVTLADGDVIKVGSVWLTYRVYFGGEETKTSPG